jgi:HEAT repeat protein
MLFPVVWLHLLGGLMSERLVAALQDPRWAVRQAAVYALCLIGPNARDAIPVIIEALKDEDIRVGAAAGDALGLIGLEANSAVAALEGGEWLDRRMAARVLGQIGPAAKAAIPALIEAVTDPNAAVREEAGRALDLIGPEASSVPALIAALEDSQTLAHALAKIKNSDNPFA